MANSSISAKSLMLAFLFIFFLFCHFITSEARILGDLPNVVTKYDSHFVLSKAGFSLKEIEEYKRRSLKGGSDRVAPGGPDPQHHSLPPNY
ncbi:hypothetical protein A4A49_18960 [Nicotiana attenuata]|uniref:Uncharacterized protein n=1 Tax=Nicotiana attenuata TaxID=49451 RepID=A0A1J6KU91_NICAT|nr:hypothetical protein A4A49_18960 [Nicotiana attenuata]